FSAMNETYLELGGSNRGTVEQGKILAFGIWLVLFTAFVFPSLVIIHGVLFYPENFTNPLQDLLMFLKVSTLVSLGAIFPIGGFIYGMLSNVRTLA
ncbi:hypothetical protein C4E44_32165, partial [Pseudomonas sp. MWU12-2312b]